MKNFTKEDALCLMNEAGLGIGGSFYVEDMLRFMSLVVERADLNPRLLDGQLRRLWSQYAANIHGWPTIAKMWHELADKLFEVSEHADMMRTGNY